MPLARWRANDQLREVRTADLRFTLAEADRFLNDVMGADLAADDVAALHDQTDGWVAGLQLAALALRGRADHDRVLQTLAGNQRHIVDYLTEEVVLQQPADVQEFLLRTAILDRLCGPLCDAITGGNDGQTMLERLERANLFLIPLDQARRWYRYHPLFTGVLRRRLERKGPDQAPALHRRAAFWYEQEGQPIEAIEHALAAADSATAARLMDGMVRTLLMRGQAATVLRWLTALLANVLREQPELGLVYGWALAHTGQLDAVELWLQEVERTWLMPRTVPEASGVASRNGAAQYVVATLPPVPAEGDSAAATMAPASEVAAIRARVAAMRGDIPATIELSQQALARLPAERTLLRSDRALNLGFAHESTGDFVAAHQFFAEAERIARAGGNARAALLATRYLARSEVRSGRLHDAGERYAAALRLCEQTGHRRLPAAGMACVGLGELSYEWNDLDASMRHLREGIELGERGGEQKIIVAGYAALARLLQAEGDAAGADAALQKAERLVGAGPLVGARAWLALMQGDVATATRWARDHAPSDDGLAHADDYRLLARLRLAQGRPDEAKALLERLLASVETAGWTGSVVQTLALQAVALHATGSTRQARQMLDRALTLAEPEGYVRVFLDEGAPMAHLLDHRRASRRGPSTTDGIGKTVLLSTGAGEAPGGIPRHGPVHRAVLPHEFPLSSQERGLGGEVPRGEALSQRERTALRLLAAGLPNQDMAREMVVTLNTVKTHVKNIYGKLGVHRRAQAAARARTLGLL